MNPNIANRIGIILNFIGTFLVAPELFGLDRLIKIESWIKSIFSRSLQIKLKTSLASIWSDRNTTCLGFLLSLIGVGIFGAFMYAINEPSIMNNSFIKNATPWVGGWMAVWVMIVLIMSAVDRNTSISSHSKKAVFDVTRVIFVITLLPLLIPAICLSIVIIALPLSIISLPFLLLLEIVNLLIKILSGPKALNRIAVRLGVFLLIVGTVLQLIATF